MWRHTSGSVPAKDEITNAYAAADLDPDDNDLIAYFGMDRFAQNGSANIGFWFMQNTIAPAPGGTFSGTPHQVGDVLVLSEFTNGGAVATISVYKWDPANADTNGTLLLLFRNANADCGSSTLTSDAACATVNSAPTASPWPYDPKQGVNDIFPKGGFFEGGINLTQLFGAGSTPCFSSFLAETRSSPAVDAVLKDFVAGGFPLCDASIEIAGDAVNEVGDPHTFTVTLNALFGGAAQAPADGTNATVTFSSPVDVGSDSCATDGTVNGQCTVTFTSDTPGTFTATATADIPVGDQTLTRTTDGSGDNSGPATKVFADADISIDPDDVNGIGEPHTFTVDVDQHDGVSSGPGTNGHVDVLLSDAGGAINEIDAANSTCDDAGDNLDANGQCTITFVSDAAGTVTGTATVTLTITTTEGDIVVTRSTDGSGDNSDGAVKTYLDGTLEWTKVDDQGAALGGATFEVCQTHEIDSSTDPDSLVDITDVCVAVLDDSPPDTNATPGSFKLEDLVLGRYTVRETVAPDGYALDPDTEVVVIDTADTSGVIATAFVDPALYKLLVITCNTTTEELVDSTVTLNGDTKQTIGAGQLPAGLSEATLCGLPGATYDDLLRGNYDPDVQLPSTP